MGAAVFGAGGGGDPLMGHLLAKHAIATHGPVELVSLDELPDEAMIIPSAMVGAPTVMIEKFAAGDEGDRLSAAMEAATGKPVAALCLAELGGNQRRAAVHVGGAKRASGRRLRSDG